MGDFSTVGAAVLQGGSFLLVAWLVYHTFSHTVPRLAQSHTESLKEQRSVFSTELREQRAEFARELREQRKELIEVLSQSDERDNG